MDHWCGIDLGSHVDYSAVSVLTRSLAVNARTGMPFRDSRKNALYEWRLRAISRFPLRTPYPQIAREIARVALMPELGPRPRVAVDATGVGVACLELIRTELAGSPAEVWGVSITAGEGWRVIRRGELNASKVQLVGAFRATLESGRFRVSRNPDGSPIAGADVLEKELAAFKVKTSQRSDAEIFGADAGKHDDCVLSVSLPVLLGSLPFMRMRELRGDDDQPFRPREASALEAEGRTIREAEQVALMRERGDETREMREARRAREKAFNADPFGPQWDHLWTRSSEGK
jgi:hypothetical protein